MWEYLYENAGGVEARAEPIGRRSLSSLSLQYNADDVIERRSIAACVRSHWGLFGGGFFVYKQGSSFSFFRSSSLPCVVFLIMSDSNLYQSDHSPASVGFCTTQ